MARAYDLWLQGIGVEVDKVAGITDTSTETIEPGAVDDISSIEALDEQSERARSRCENLENVKGGLELVTHAMDGMELIRDVVKDQWPVVKKFIEEAGLEEDLELLEKSGEVVEFITEFGKLIVTFKQGGSAGEVFAETLDLVVAGVKVLPAKCQQKFIEAIGGRFAKYLGPYGSRAVKILGQAGRVLEVQKAMLEYMNHGGGVNTLLNELPKLGTDLGPPVVGLLVQIATSELGPDKSKLAGDIAEKIIQFGAQALDRLGKNLIKAQDDLGDAYSHGSRVAAKAERQFEKAGRELGLDARQAMQFTQACQLGGKDRVLDLLSSLKQTDDMQGLKSALRAFGEANRQGILDGRVVDGLDKQSDKQKFLEMAACGIQTATRLAMSAQKGSIERRFYEALLVDEQAIQKTLFDMAN